MRARHASTSSRDESSRRRRAAVASTTPRSAGSLTAAIIARPPWNNGRRPCIHEAMAPRAASSRTVRDVAFDVFRRRDLTTMFANPGSTEVPFLAGLPDDFHFVLGLHEGAVVGMATGYAIGRRKPALVLLHTTAGLGNAVGALATARVNRTPLVVVVGQQDRRHLAFEPFLAGPARRPRRRLPRQGRAARPGAGRPRRARARVPRGGDGARPGARDRPDGRLGGACGRRTGSRLPRSGRSSVRRLHHLPRSTLSPTSWRMHDRRRSSSARPQTTQRRGRRSLSWPSAWPRRSSRSRSAPVPASPRTIRGSPGCFRPTGPGSGLCSRPTTGCSSSARPRSARWCTQPGASPSPGRGSRS